MNRPLILINGGMAYDRQFHGESFTINKTYTGALVAAGGTPFTALDWDRLDEYAEMADGLLLTGATGFSPDPALKPPMIRNELDHKLIDAVLKAGKPIMGICLGLQQINVHFGGDLYYNFKFDFGREHMMSKHAIKTERGSILNHLFGDEFYVNSRHNIRIGKLAEDLVVTARAIPDDDVIEAIEHKTLPVFGVQWHPERIRGDYREPPEGPDMTPLFEYFIRLCEDEKKKRGCGCK